jgi:hypothetical protein
MPQLWEWEQIWLERPTHIHHWKVPAAKRKSKAQ